MTQIDPKDLDYSSFMKAYFENVEIILVDRYRQSPREARALVNRFFALDVDPLERALLMHSDARRVAADLVGENEKGVRISR